jgi:murein DD-endopeptidase MepM/ murein hydrolase activator NlpD
VRRALAALSVLGVLFALLVSSAQGVGSTTSCNATASGARTTPAPSPSPCPTPDPNQALYDHLKSRLGGDLARALTSQQRLSTALDQSAATQLVLNNQIAQEEAKIADLESQLAALDQQIADTQSRIDTEKTQIASLARAIYRQPDSLLQLIASTGSLREALVATADLVISGQRAHDLETRLEGDLANLQTQRDARQADLDRETTARDTLQSSLTELAGIITTQTAVGAQLATLIQRVRAALSVIKNQPPSVTAALATLLEQLEQDLIQKAYQAAWSQAQVGAGIAYLSGELPGSATLWGLVLSWPMSAGAITQGFGPSTLVLEPPLGPYAHFHTGIDIAASPGTVVMAAADGVVVAIAHSSIGYGNYVIVAHGGGIMTLYAHLLQTEVQFGDRVMRGQRIGLEGATGLATGPHVHFELRVNNQVVDPMQYLPSTPAITT